VQHVFGAVSGPQGDEAVILVGEFSATADRDQSRVADLREDHVTSVPATGQPGTTFRYSRRSSSCADVDGVLLGGACGTEVSARRPLRR
jgi:hypothetical protein